MRVIFCLYVSIKFDSHFVVKLYGFVYNFRNKKSNYFLLSIQYVLHVFFRWFSIKYMRIGNLTTMLIEIFFFVHYDY